MRKRNEIIVLDVLPTETGNTHQWCRILDRGGISPTLTSGDYKQPLRVLVTKKEKSDDERK